MPLVLVAAVGGATSNAYLDATAANRLRLLDALIAEATASQPAYRTAAA